MGVYSNWESESGYYHGRLQRCGWTLCDDPADAPACAAGIELKVTSPEGEGRWLVDENQYGYEYDSEAAEEWGKYGHRCGGERCAEFFEEFGWELFPEGQDSGLGLSLETENGEREVQVYNGGQPLTPIPEEGDEEMLGVGEVDEGLLDRLADALFGECEPQGERAVEESASLERRVEEKKRAERESRMWERDPFYVSNMSWADMAEEDEEW
jgi:hypothetical protein